MKNIIARLKADAKINIPDVWDKIEGDAKNMAPGQNQTKRRFKIRYKIAAAACLLLVLGGMFIFPSLQNFTKDEYHFNSLFPPGMNYDKNKNSKPEDYINKTPAGNYSGEEYNPIRENVFLSPANHPLSTFSIDVDSASYSIVRRYLKKGETVPSDAVRIEELINYFNYDYPKPQGGEPFSVYTELADCPWNKENKLLLIGLKGKEVDIGNIPPSNLVFLLDVSGSMSTYDKLPLVKQAFSMLIENLRENDRISIVTYAGSDSVLLNGEHGNNKTKIADAISALESGGGTAGARGIETAYEIAKQNFIEEGNNRVILATDGDFNVGVSSQEGLKTLIENKRKDGIYLSVLGFGTGNLKDNTMETLSQYGNGNYAYIDSALEAKRVLVEEMGGTLLTIAKDVKLQLEFYKEKVKNYRLIGYENRLLESEDFNDDQKDAGEMGAGHRVTAIYEIVPQKENLADGSGWTQISIRYKNPGQDTSRLMTLKVDDSRYSANMSDTFAFASAVAEFGMVLKNSEYKGSGSYQNAYDRVRNMSSIRSDQYKMEFVDFLRKLSD